MIWITLLTGFVLYLLLNKKLNLSSGKAVLWQLGVVVLLILIGALNAFYNWGYFKQYEGPPTQLYYFARSVGGITLYGIVLVSTLIACSLIAIIRKDKISTRRNNIN